MKYLFVLDQERLFELSGRVPAPSIARGELLSHQAQLYQIVDIEHLTHPDGGLDRMRLETRVYLRLLSPQEVAARREAQAGGAARSAPLRY